MSRNKVLDPSHRLEELRTAQFGFVHLLDEDRSLLDARQRVGYLTGARYDSFTCVVHYHQVVGQGLSARRLKTRLVENFKILIDFLSII